MPLSKNILTWCLLQFYENQIFIYRSSYFRELIAIMQIINKLGNHVSVVEWADTYGIHHWWILWSSYRKLTWVGFEPTTTEFCSDALTDWAIRPCFNSHSEPTLYSYSNFIVCSVSHFISAVCLCQSPRLF